MAAEPNRALPKGSLVLVTGASGYIGSNVCRELLEAGYKVRGTSRSDKSAQNVKNTLNNPDFSIVIVSDFEKDSAFDEALEDVDAIINVASDTSFGHDPNDVIPAAKSVLESLLRSAENSKSLKRFVHTSSSTAVLLPHPGKDVTVDGDTWNEEAMELAWAPPPYTSERAFSVYSASKVESERVLWKFMKEKKPHFVANAVLPNANFGRILTTSGASGEMPKRVLKGEVPGLPPQWYIDVVDDARLHVIAAVLDSSLVDERIFAFAETFTWAKIIKLLKELRPDSKTLPSPPENEDEDLSKVPNQLGADLLKKWYGQETGYKPLKQSLEENIKGE